MAFPKLFPLHTRNGSYAEVATDASTVMPLIRCAGGGQVHRVVFTAVSSDLASGTTTGSSASLTLFKNVATAASIIATFNGSGTTVATLATATLATSGTAGTVNARFGEGDLLIGQMAGGAASVVGAGSYIQVEYVYGRDTGLASAGTGPA